MPRLVYAHRLVQQRMRDLSLFRFFQRFFRPIRKKERHQVLLAAKADVRTRNVVSCDEVQVLALQFAHGVLFQVCRFRRKPHQHLRCRLFRAERL